MTTVPVVQATLGLQMQQDEAFTPPPKIKELGGSVDLDLALGTQHLWVAAEIQTTVTYGDLTTWEGLTAPGRSPHRFVGSSIGGDSEVSGDWSSNFSKIVALAFMAGYAETCWYKVLKPLWGDTLVTARGPLRISKKVEDDPGPDYFAAPFDPTSAERGGPFYALEFKGQKAKVDFSSPSFVKWIEQANNISITDEASGKAVSVKSWTLAFNYGFETPKGSRGESTLLVADPQTSPGAPLLEPLRLNGSSIIRDHLAREALRHRAGTVAAHVRAGVSLEAVRGLPAVYAIRHARLHGRRYIGQWFRRLGSRDLIPAPGPLLGWRQHGGGPPGWSWLESPDGEVHLHGRGPWIDNLLGRGTIFVGQDATMLRRCTQVALDHELDGEPFQDEIDFYELAGDAPYAPEIRVLRNGSLLAVNYDIEQEDSSFWHRH